MAANVKTEMRIPSRAAPHPPNQSATRRDPIWSTSNDIFEGALAQSVQKKKPPPRPPPPKFNQSHMQNQKDQKSRKPTRPTELLTSFFGRKRQEGSYPSRSTSQSQNFAVQSTSSVPTMSLIDLSPPESPTFTTRSSDAVSVDSFGSDGNSNPSAFTSSGNTSQTESAFEDDFDFFGMSRKTAQNDPWQSKTTPQDPFGPLEEPCPCPNPSQASNNACLFPANQVPSTVIASKPLVTSLSTIRARPPKPAAPKLPLNKLEPTISTTKGIHKGRKNHGICNSGTSTNTTNTLTLDVFNAWPNEQNDPSPPMPTIPPPALPASYSAELNTDLAGDHSKPYGVALYDFPKTHRDDLALKEGDIVQLIEKVNDDWLKGKIGNCYGIFPFNFIDIKVPLPDNVVTALYSFLGENSNDLSFKEGEKITVLSRISKDWLYGEYNGKKGQFPVNYVNRLPRNI